MSRNHYIQKVRCCPGSFAGGLRGFRRYFMGNIKVKQMSHYVKQRSGHRVLPSGRMCGSILASVFPVRSSDCARNTGWATTELNNGPAESRRMAFQVYLDWVKKKKSTSNYWETSLLYPWSHQRNWSGKLQCLDSTRPFPGLWITVFSSLKRILILKRRCP